MNKLVLHPTEISQWHALVYEAQASSRLMLSENTESYLVFLLMRFSQEIKLIESVVALDFLNSEHKPRQQQAELLREVGDKSLLFCGLFPGMAEKRHVSLNYFIDMGQAAYFSVGELNDSQSTLYFQLSEQFLMLQQILKSMRGEVLHHPSSDSIWVSPRDLPLQ
ncbi:MAG: hypothetical protein H0U70_11090 [Tatlockia sp.]|nr:hypothetical protein [Tatlockia sp.]